MQINKSCVNLHRKQKQIIMKQIDNFYLFALFLMLGLVFEPSKEVKHKEYRDSNNVAKVFKKHKVAPWNKYTKEQIHNKEYKKKKYYW